MNRQLKGSFASKGFTLIEVLVVVVILGILASVVMINVLDEPDRAAVEAARADVRTLETALEMYKLNNHHYPSTDQGLQALVQRPGGQPDARNWKPGGYVKVLPRDYWGNDYLYLNPGIHGQIDIYSLGKDGLPGGDGFNADIGNWER